MYFEIEWRTPTGQTCGFVWIKVGISLVHESESDLNLKKCRISSWSINADVDSFMVN